MSTFSRPTLSARQINVSKLGWTIDPQWNEQHRQALQTGATLTQLAEDFIFPFAAAGDAAMIRFPFSPLVEPAGGVGYMYFWHDAWRCPESRYADIVNFARGCRSNGLKPFLYLPEATDAELKEAQDKGDIAHPFHRPEWDGVTLVGDMWIGSVRRNPTSGKLRQRLLQCRRDVVIEPGWDRNCTEDHSYPIVVTTSLYKQVESGAVAHTWRWPWPRNGTGPRIWLWHHEAFSQAGTAGERRQRIVDSLRAHWQLCRGRYWSAFFPAAYAKNHAITREEIVAP